MTYQTFNMMYNKIEEITKPEVIVAFVNTFNSNFEALNSDISSLKSEIGELRRKVN